jgi:hypothetical protein
MDQRDQNQDSTNQDVTAGTGTGVRLHTGGCHCGAVRFQVELDPQAGGSRCNCSICSKISLTTAIVKPEAFRLLSAPDKLNMYEWGGKTGQRFFCKTCGVHCYGPGYLEQVGGAYVSVSLNCLDDVDANQLPIVHWDGRHNNWQAGPRKTPWPIFAAS